MSGIPGRQVFSPVVITERTLKNFKDQLAPTVMAVFTGVGVGNFSVLNRKISVI